MKETNHAVQAHMREFNIEAFSVPIVYNKYVTMTKMV